MTHRSGTFFKVQCSMFPVDERPVEESWSPDSLGHVIFNGDARSLLSKMEAKTVDLVITSPPYNIGKIYEEPVALEEYLERNTAICEELVRVLADSGSLCWQVGNYVDKGEIVPLDIPYYAIFKRLGLQLRNRIIWTFNHGLHASNRFSGRYETILWFTKTPDYDFNLDAVRVPAKYPGKRHYKGNKIGQPSGNPLGKNPSDVWKIVEQDWRRRFGRFRMSRQITLRRRNTHASTRLSSCNAVFWR